MTATIFLDPVAAVAVRIHNRLERTRDAVNELLTSAREAGAGTSRPVNCPCEASRWVGAG